MEDAAAAKATVVGVTRAAERNQEDEVEGYSMSIERVSVEAEEEGEGRGDSSKKER